MARMFEVRYKDGAELVAHQHSSESAAKLDAKEISKSRGRSMLGEVEVETNNLIRIVEWAGGVMGKWVNRSGPIIPCKVLLTVEDTLSDKPSLFAPSKAEISEEEKARKKAALENIRAQQRAKEKPADKSLSREKPAGPKPETERRAKLIAEGHEPALADLICKTGVHIGSPNSNALISMWKCAISAKEYPAMNEKQLSVFMSKLRALLIANETGKSIVARGGPKALTYQLVDFQLEILEEVA